MQGAMAIPLLTDDDRALLEGYFANVLVLQQSMASSMSR